MTQVDPGTLEVISGCMFADKSSTLIRRLQRARLYEKRQVIALKPHIDGRYSTENLASHGGLRFTAVPVKIPADILLLPAMREADLVGLDEAQFFDTSIVGVCMSLVMRGKHVLVTGLDLDYTGRPFGPMPTLLALADVVTKVHAACTVCGAAASRSQRVVNSSEQVLVGGASAYEARCLRHWGPEPVFAQQDLAMQEERDG